MFKRFKEEVIGYIGQPKRARRRQHCSCATNATKRPPNVTGWCTHPLTYSGVHESSVQLS